MKINVEFLIGIYFISLFVDWVFQMQWQAVNKSKWNKEDNKLLSLQALFSHSFIYALFTTVFTLPFFSVDKSGIVFLVLFITHFLIDSRIPVKWIMKLKGMNDEQIYDYKNFGFMHIGIDHRLHEIVLLTLAIFI